MSQMFGSFSPWRRELPVIIMTVIAVKIRLSVNKSTTIRVSDGRELPVHDTLPLLYCNLRLQIYQYR